MYHSPTDLPTHIQYVWHGVNDAANLRHFLGSSVEWAELDVNWNAESGWLILRHDSFEELPRRQGESDLLLSETLPLLLQRGKSLKIDFKVGGDRIAEVLVRLDRFAIPQSRLWFNADLDLFGEAWVRTLSDRYPQAILQAPLHSVFSLADGIVDKQAVLGEVAGWGINRWSVGWDYPDVPGILTTLRSWGYETNLYGVRNLDEFLEAVALDPRSVTADFNFPAWHLFGRGSGHKGEYYAYVMAAGD